MCEDTLSVITEAEWKRLKSRPLKKAELSLWNAHVQATDADDVFEEGLQLLKKILDQAEVVI